ncbi:bifunctional 4-hydroxy-2-oxoglutarate aldolase/2-dehydro-3-deoxy-phosphogluconate aldolase [Gryllotalpicola protaetiae]|uniref:Bifunctional 4-hydroxy-2-oxoglutarate aldolase/2-dehydro-3-deoxy-phosphogluconate aldolase n=1 Tax=Gryllotalpicola protaetiae TaxID=2419771 RepID=A0A387BRM8_9MICO|nr:bifunctional 4-hydroxy-2-oxoglutarate aldolase/2-dehydro-3-deoxy-phosphogluconate aldolase [Gryllotalpicola protaetiae]AYG03636.1 bifunctional 4-hydroxy-2-oxoglutarate aldolase/2-dehydro-3-deoxy-phosphogluconate aldolase [Gryllotalpicola protaetiae]
MAASARTDALGARIPLPAVMCASGVVAVLRARDAAQYLPVVRALAAGGVRSIELTLTTAGAIEELPRLRAALGEQAEFGIGTVTSEADAAAAVDAGAEFIVTPNTDLAVIGLCVRRGVPVIPGGLTPSELFAGWKHGASAVKLFPASTVGPDYLGQLRGPFPGLPVVPSGGVGADDAAAWIDAGAVAVSVGGPLLQDAFRGGDLDALTERARRLVAAVRDRRGAR